MVRDPVLVPAGAVAGAADEPLGMIHCHHDGAGVRHAAGEAARAAGDVQHPLAGPEGQQPLRGWLDEEVLEVVPVADPIVPPLGEAVPDLRGARRILGEVRRGAVGQRGPP